MSRILRLGLFGLTLAAAVKYVATLSFQSDTAVMLGEVDSLLTAVHNGKWSNWGGQFPLLQKIPAIVLKSQGLNTQACLAVLAFVNLAAFACLLWLAWRSLARWSRRSAVLFAAIVLSSPLLWYARSSFSEVLAASCTLGLVVACWERAQSWKVLMWFVAAGISKDTIFPFLFVLALLSTRIGRQPSGAWVLQTGRIWLLSAACAITVLVNVTFNYLRFGSVLNLAYLTPIFIVPKASIQVSFFLGLLFAPNGGLLFFWPAFVLWMLLAGICAAKMALSQARRLPLVPWITIVLVFLGIVLGLSKWYAPLGWVCWGPRLLLPTLPALTYLLSVYYGPEMRLWLAKTLLRKGVAWLTGGVLGLAALPNFAVLFTPDIMTAFFKSDAACPREAVIQRDPEYYYHCITHGLWAKHAGLLDVYTRVSLHEDFLYAALCSLLLASLVVTASNNSRPAFARG